MGSGEPTVHIIDDDELLRRALDGLFRSVGLKARGYGSVREFLDGGLEDTPGCLVLDVPPSRDPGRRTSSTRRPGAFLDPAVEEFPHRTIAAGLQPDRSKEAIQRPPHLGIRRRR